VFVSRARNGRHARQTARNVQARLRTAVKAANAKLAEVGLEPIGAVSPHSLRRTYASLRAALRDDPVYIAEQLGHRDARFTFRVYQRAAKRRERLSGAHLAEFDRATDWAAVGPVQAPDASATETSRQARALRR
jgi:integrase